MKHIMNVLKNEIFNQNTNLESLIKKVTVSQESYLKDRSNDGLFSIWSEAVKELQKTESNLRSLRNAYSIICKACDVEPKTISEIVAEKSQRKERKPRAKKTVNQVETKAE